MEKLALAFAITQGIQSQANRNIKELKEKGAANSSQIQQLQKQLQESKKALQNAQTKKGENSKRISTLEAARQTALAATAVKVWQLKTKQKAVLKNLKEEQNQKLKQELESKAKKYETQQKNLEKTRKELQTALNRAQQSEEQLTAATKKLTEFESETAAVREKINEMKVQTNQSTKTKLIELINSKSNLESLLKLYNNQKTAINNNSNIKSAYSQQEEFIKRKQKLLKNLETQGFDKKYPKKFTAAVKTFMVATNKSLNEAQLRKMFLEKMDLPIVFIFLNRLGIGMNKHSDYTKFFEDMKENTDYEMLKAKNSTDATSKSTPTIQNLIKDFISTEVNLFFTGPSGSGKTTLFDAFINGKTKSETITIYAPIFELRQVGGKNAIVIKDEIIKNKTIEEFKKDYIRPTPFNPQSSRAHMSIDIKYEGKSVRVFDLAGSENPLRIMKMCLNINLFQLIAEDTGGKIEQTGKKWVEYENLMKKDTSIYNHKSPTEFENYIKELVFRAFGSFAQLPRTKTQAGISLPPRDMSDKRGKKGEKSTVELWYQNNFFNTLSTNLGEKNPSEDIVIQNMSARYKGKPLCLFIFDVFKRVLEGLYITRTLFSLQGVYSIEQNQNMVSKLKIIRNKKSKNTYLTSAINTNNSVILKTDETTMNELAKKYVNLKDEFTLIPGYNGIKYLTKFQKTVAERKNILIGVVQGNPKEINVKNQQIAALKYFRDLKMLSPKD